MHVVAVALCRFGDRVRKRGGSGGTVVCVSWRGCWGCSVLSKIRLCVSGKKKTTALCLLDCLFLLLFSVFVEQVKEEDHCGLGPVWRSLGGGQKVSAWFPTKFGSKKHKTKQKVHD